MDDEPVIRYATRKKLKTLSKELLVVTGFAVKKGSNPELIKMFNNVD